MNRLGPLLVWFLAAEEFAVALAYLYSRQWRMYGRLLGRSRNHRSGGAEMIERNRRTSLRISDIERTVESIVPTKMTPFEQVINTLEHISTTSIPAAQMRRILRETLQTLYTVRNAQRQIQRLTQ